MSFYGGAGTVTGSRFLLETERTKILIDCGLFQGLKELRLLNWQPAVFPAASLDAVVLTHAHIDHTGYLPRLVKEGFAGRIYCTRATAELLPILLRDAAHLQEEDAEYANRKGFSKHHPALPLYTEAEAEKALKHLKAVPLGEELTIGDFTVRYHDAGHILGAAFVEVVCNAESPPHRIVFSGDLGRRDDPLHPDPEHLPVCDTLVMESTYGDRIHPKTPLIEQIRGSFQETFSRRGIVLIPAFAVARAQMVLLLLARLMADGRLPRVPIHIDSPMAADVTSLYRRYAGTKRLDVDRSDLFPPNVSFHRTVEESQRLNNLIGPRIIISSSGMLTGGRVLHHLRRLLPKRENLILLVGYQAAGTRGRSLLMGAETVRMHGMDIPVRARIQHVDELSAHADAHGLLEWALSAQVPPGLVFLVHGEPEASAALSEQLQERGLRVEVPALNSSYELSDGKWLGPKLPPPTHRR
ncbi:MAG: MBL fold metallo-hydrolase RNA specificity domain-containing protein [Dehalococcoidia bacterium]